MLMTKFDYKFSHLLKFYSYNFHYKYTAKYKTAGTLTVLTDISSVQHLCFNLYIFL